MSDSYNERLGKILRSIRKQRNNKNPGDFTLQALEPLVGALQPYMSKVENGVANCSTSILIDWCKAIGVPPSVVLALAAYDESKFTEIDKRMQSVAIAQLKKLGLKL